MSIRLRPALPFLLAWVSAGLAASPAHPAQRLPKAAAPVFHPPSQVFEKEITVTLSTTTPGAKIFFNWYDQNPDSVERNGTFDIGRGMILSSTHAVRAWTIAPGYEPSDVVREVYTLKTEVSVVSADFIDWHGDGRIGRVVLLFSKYLPALPERMAFNIRDQNGKTDYRLASSGEISFTPSGSTDRVIVDLKDPFPFGMTSVVNNDSAGHLFIQDNVPLTDMYFPIAEMVAPVIVDAKILERGAANPQSILYILFSERVGIPQISSNPLLVSRQGVPRPAGELKIARVEKVGDMLYAFHVDSTSAFQPLAGDSVAIPAPGEIADLYGRKPDFTHFQRLERTFQSSALPVPAAPSLDLRATREGLLRGAWLRAQTPQAIRCYDLGGVSLGAAMPVGLTGDWRLPARKPSMVLMLRMRDGSRFPYVLR